MKFKTSKKEMLENAYVIAAPYCAFESLLRFKSPVAYTAGVHGWNCDIYQIGNNWYIATGYRPFGNVTVDIDVINDIEQRANKAICNERDIYSLQNHLHSLLEELMMNGACKNELHF